jgi:hypothetical protein
LTLFSLAVATAVLPACSPASAASRVLLAFRAAQAAAIQAQYKSMQNIDAVTADCPSA